MLGKTHRITGIAAYTGLLMQATRPVHTFNQSNVILKTLDSYITTPVLDFLHLTQLRGSHVTGASIAQFMMMAMVYGVILSYGLVLPDVDSKNSTLGRYLPFIEDTVGHRTIFHSIFVVIALGLISFMTSGLLQVVFALLTASYYFHLVEDAYSLQGINWIVFPVKRRWAKYRYKVDGAFEHVVFYIAWLVTLVNVSILLYASSALKMIPKLFNFTN